MLASPAPRPMYSSLSILLSYNGGLRLLLTFSYNSKIYIISRYVLQQGSIFFVADTNPSST